MPHDPTIGPNCPTCNRPTRYAGGCYCCYSCTHCGTRVSSGRVLTLEDQRLLKSAQVINPREGPYATINR